MIFSYLANDILSGSEIKSAEGSGPPGQLPYYENSAGKHEYSHFIATNGGYSKYFM